jgi:pyrimidine-nucleoside phosphorylase
MKVRQGLIRTPPRERQGTAPMIPAKTIALKRDGGQLSPEQLAEFVQGYVSGAIPDYQMAALAMAIFLRGMTLEETVCLTQKMLDSGHRLPRHGDALRVDKHSTGGLGDKVSLVLAPLLACLDFHIPMISGRGLGITGGTLDKLESIPGFRTNLDSAEIATTLAKVGCVICGTTAEIAPADRKLYALRDVTATVESVPLITASILSKKLAESLDALVLDVKVGSGALMPTLDAARRLANTLVSVANRLGVRTTALLTNMDEPLGRMVGNAVEVQEAVDTLQGGGPRDLRELTLALASELMVGTGVAECADEARRQLAAQLDQGFAYERFVAMVAAQGGRLSLDTLTPSHEVTAVRSGYVSRIDGRALGDVLIELGGGRKRMTDPIDHRVGLELLVRVGDSVQSGMPLMRVYSRNAEHGVLDHCIRAAIMIDAECSPEMTPLILGRVETHSSLSDNS